jgi:hypothetical protein
MTNTQKLLINAICAIRSCDLPARWNIEIIGHPNGDAAAAYCHKHAEERAGSFWDESPKAYSVVVTGPFEGKK